MVNLILAIEKLLGLQVSLVTVDVQQNRAENNFPLYAIFRLAERLEEEKKIWCMQEEMGYL